LNKLTAFDPIPRFPDWSRITTSAGRDHYYGGPVLSQHVSRRSRRGPCLAAFTRQGGQILMLVVDKLCMTTYYVGIVAWSDPNPGGSTTFSTYIPGPAAYLGEVEVTSLANVEVLVTDVLADPIAFAVETML
jgi:hypothetical protein